MFQRLAKLQRSDHLAFCHNLLRGRDQHVPLGLAADRGRDRVGDVLAVKRALRLREVFTLDQFHYQRAAAGGFFEAVNMRNVWMVQRGKRLHLTREARHWIRIAREGVEQNLPREVATQFRIARPMDFAHAAGADAGDDFVRAEEGARGEGQLLCSIRAGRQCGRDYSRLTPQ